MKIYFKYILLVVITVVPFFPLCPPLSNTPISNISPHLWFMFMGHEYEFFGFSISYTILNITLSILYLPIMLLNPCIISPFSPFPIPADNPPNDLHTYDSVPVLVVCLVCFCFLGLAVDSCEFVILMFIVLIFFLLNKSL